MRGTFRAFNGLVRSLLVRRGEDEVLKHKGKSVNTFETVYTEMFIQVCRDYQNLPDPRTIKAHEILFFYNGLRNELCSHTKPKG